MGKSWRAGGKHQKYAAKHKTINKEEEEESYSNIEPFYVDTKPDEVKNFPKASELTEKASLEESDTSSDDDYIQNVTESMTDDKDTDENDEEFAQLIQEYHMLMSPEKDLEWILDENAARILRERKQNDPKYAQMSQEEFDEIICFDEVYGVRHGRGMRSRSRRHKESEACSMQHSPRGQTPIRHNPRRSNTLQSEPELEINFKQLNRDIKAFVHSKESDEMEIAPYPPLIRKLIHELAHMYVLQSKSNGKGVDRHCVLTKSENTRLPRDLKRLDKFLEGAQKAARYAYGRKDTHEKKGKRQTPKASTSTARVAPGSVVGGEATPIEDDNIGNLMLRKLGWSPGQGLGSEKSGRTDPVEAIYRGNRTGLGH